MKKAPVDTHIRNVLCFGDSNTWACEPFKHIASTPTRLKKSDRWTRIMAQQSSFDVDVIEDGLSARTTVFDDPVEGPHKNGSRLLIASIETHAPLDIVVLMLGTNDFKLQFGANAFMSARGMLTLIQQIKGYYALAEGGPEVLIVAPPMIMPIAEKAYWGDAAERCQGHAEYLAQVADRTGCFFFDSNSVASAGRDGVHLSVEGHHALGRALGKVISEILEIRSM
ncbi:GDSL-type esterase/lipase family protein [Celeribacter sp.]|uniref:GDSL-type esterase/lipase family protein n=1 Tax=Celeribacter sp. TaxID=1890673 RepID=UPI003A8D1701